MRISNFHDRLNKIGSNVHSIEEEITMPQSGVYEAELQHDNVNDDTVQVYTGPNLTGTPVGYTLSVPTDESWKRIIKIETETAVVYITYETIGDQIEADDINDLQDELVRTQNALTILEAEVSGSISGYTWNRLMGISSEDILEITEQPESQTVEAGEQATFTIVAIGSSITYKWQYVEPGESSWINFSGGNAATLTVTPASTWNGRQIRCVLSDANGLTAISNTVTLTVT